MNILEILADLGGYWKYDGGRYLAELASGKVSDCFFNLSTVTSDPEALKLVVELLSGAVDKAGIMDHDGPTHVCGPSMGGITLAYEIACAIGAKAIFTEKEGDSQVLKRFEVGPYSTILMVEDVITTGASTEKMMNGLRHRGTPTPPRLLPYVLCIVNRTGRDKLNTLPYPSDGFQGDGHLPDIKIIAAAEVEARTWDTLEEAQEELPDVLDAVRPKANWEQLVNG